MIESVTGIIVLLVVSYTILVIGLFRINNRLVRTGSLFLILLLPVLFTFFLRQSYKDFSRPVKNDLENLESFTLNGNPYVHDTITQPVENGGYIGLYVCEPELRDEWNKVSDFDFYGKDKRGQDIKYTLIRYLNSKNLRKDSAGVAQLTKKDIYYIEKGIANIYYTHPLSINSRLYKLFWEYQVFLLGGNPGGHSIIQRLEFWKVSIGIIKENFLFGVGTGDIKEAYAEMYEKLNSVLEPQWRHRAHNQFLAIFVTFGLLGFVWFLISLIYPGIKLKRFNMYLYFVFFLTIILSMLFEDTLETQMGVSLYAFFNAFLLFAVKRE